MSATPPPAQRPHLEENPRERGWTSWLLQEWGLLVLAAVLAVLIWEITSQAVIKEQVIANVRVRLVIAAQDVERVGAVLNSADTRVDLALTGSERERFAVLEALTAVGGGTPVLELQVSPEISDESRDISDTLDFWRWPVDNADAIGLRASMRDIGRVYKIEGMQQVHIAQPETIPATSPDPRKGPLAQRGFQLQLLDPGTTAATHIQVTPGFVEFLAPRAVLGGGEGALTMTPDPISLEELLAGEAPQVGEVKTFTLTFNRWRSATDVQVAERERVRQYRASLPPIKATARLALQPISALQADGRLEVMLDPQFDWDWDGPAPQAVIRDATPMSFVGELVGPADALAEIAANPDKWMWAIYVTEPEAKPGEEGGWPKVASMMDPADQTRKGVRATIEWVPQESGSHWIQRGVRFKPSAAKGEDQFFVKVFPRKKKGP